MVEKKGSKVHETKEPIAKKSNVEIQKALKDLKENELFNEVYEQIQENSEEYTVQRGDTLSSIAKRVGVGSYIDLLYLNNILENPLRAEGKNGTKVVLKPGDKILLPIDSDLFKSHFQVIKNTYDSIELNQKVIDKDLNALKQVLEASIFNKRVQSIGLPNLLDGFIGLQQAEFDPDTPRIVDSSRETGVTCANLIRTMMGSSVNIGDLKPHEKKYLLKQNVDAWMLPTEVIKAGYRQEFPELMKQFDKGRIGLEDPLNQSKKDEYYRLVNKLGEYMKQNSEKLKGSLLPLYFIYSSKKGVVAEYNRNRGDDVHFNTHQSIFAGNCNFKFYAFEVPEIKDGKLIEFQDLPKNTGVNVDEVLGKIQDSKQKIYPIKQALKASLSEKNNRLLRNEVNKLDQFIRKECKGNNQAFEKIMEAAQTQDYNLISKISTEQLGFQVGDKYVKQVISLSIKKEKLLKDIEDINNRLEEKVEFTQIDISGENDFIKNNKLIQESIEFFNQKLEALKDAEVKTTNCEFELNTVESDLENLEAIQDLTAEQISQKASLIEKKKQLTADYQKNQSIYLESKTILYSSRDRVLSSMTINKNPELKKLSEDIDGSITKINGQDPGNKIIFRKKLESNDYLGAKAIASKNKYVLSNEEFVRVRESFLHYQAVLEALSKYEQRISDNTFSNINMNEYSPILQGNKQISMLIKDYNRHADSIIKQQSVLKESRDVLMQEKSVNVIDYICHFIQVRGDFSQKIYSNETKQRIVDGIGKYHGLIDISVNGVKVDIKSEYEKYKKSKESGLKIKNTDEITIDGPMMIDGEKQHNHKDQDRKDKMNSRTRFYFEFVVPGWYLPSEFLVPGDDSSFRRRDFGRHANKLKVKALYDLRRGDRLEDLIKEQFEIYEGLTKPIPDGKSKEQYENEMKEYNNKFRFMYARQIQALQLAGFMQSESKLNPGAFKINRSIPYYDMSGGQVDKTFRDFIFEKKQQLKSENEKLSGAKDYIELQIFPKDTYRSMYSRIQEYVQAHENKLKYGGLTYMGKLSEVQITLFMQEFVAKALKSNPDLTFDKIKKGEFFPYDKFIMSLQEINDIIINVTSNVGIEANLEPKIVDNIVLNMIVGAGHNKSLIRYVLNTETKDTDKWLGRKDIKKFLEQYPEIQEKFGAKISSLGDFQIRINSIKYGFDDEWVSKDQLQKAFDLITDENIAKIASFAPNEKEILQQYRKEKSMVDEIKSILKLPEMNGEQLKSRQKRINDLLLEYGNFKESLKDPSLNDVKRNFVQGRIVEVKTELDKLLAKNQRISDLLTKLILIDDGTSKNIVGKIVSASLLNDKLNLHITKLNGSLVLNGESTTDIYKDKSKLQDFEKAILIINNLGEQDSKFAFVENYIIRIVSSFGLQLPTQSVFYDYPWNSGTQSAKPQAGDDQSSRKTEIEGSGDNDDPSIKEVRNELTDYFKSKNITGELKDYIKQIYRTKLGKINYNFNVFKTHLKEYSDFLSKNMDSLDVKERVVASKIVEFCNDVVNGKSQILDDGKQVSVVSTFLADKSIKDYLKSKNMSDSFLPNGPEFNSTTFTRSVFNYVNKGNT